MREPNYIVRTIQYGISESLDQDDRYTYDKLRMAGAGCTVSRLSFLAEFNTVRLIVFGSGVLPCPVDCVELNLVVS